MSQPTTWQISLAALTAADNNLAYVNNGLLGQEPWLQALANLLTDLANTSLAAEQKSQALQAVDKLKELFSQHKEMEQALFNAHQALQSAIPLPDPLRQQTQQATPTQQPASAPTPQDHPHSTQSAQALQVQDSAPATKVEPANTNTSATKVSGFVAQVQANPDLDVPYGYTDNQGKVLPWYYTASGFLYSCGKFSYLDANAEGDFVLLYTDGSHDKKTGRYSYGVVALLPNGEIHTFGQAMSNPKFAKTWNIAGECEGLLAGLSFCKAHGYNRVRICHDLQGLSHWIRGYFKAATSTTTNLVNRFFAHYSDMEVGFAKVKGHSGQEFNDLADKLANQAMRGLDRGPLAADTLVQVDLAKVQQAVADSRVFAREDDQEYFAWREKNLAKRKYVATVPSKAVLSD